MVISDAQLRAAMNVLANKPFCEEMAQKKAETLSRGKPPASITPEADDAKPPMTEEQKNAEKERRKAEKRAKKLRMKEERERSHSNMLPNPEKKGSKQKDVVLDY